MGVQKEAIIVVSGPVFCTSLHPNIATYGAAHLLEREEVILSDFCFLGMRCFSVPRTEQKDGEN
jgi:hypothetical protein